MLGIAESAHGQVVETVKTRRKQPGNRLLSERAGIQHLVAENEIDLAVSRSLLTRVAGATTQFVTRYEPGSEPLDEFHLLHKEFQAAKQVVTSNAIRVADRALTLSGGSGYLNRSPLARLYRDVRAGPFMQLFSPNEVHEYIGRVALGLDANLPE
jgi:alkylation response protein AidB-like acyl-CoA dehydrogenase